MGFYFIHEELMPCCFRAADLPCDLFSCQGRAGGSGRCSAPLREGAMDYFWSFLQGMFSPSFILSSFLERERRSGGKEKMGWEWGKEGRHGRCRGEGCWKLTYFSSHVCIYTQGQVYLFPLGFNEGKTNRTQITDLV